MLSFAKLVMSLSALATLAVARPAEGRGAQVGVTAEQDHSFILGIVDSIPRQDALAVVVRDPAPGKVDIVLLKASAATPELLLSVLAELEANRSLDTAITTTTYEFFASAKPVGAVAPEKLQKMSAALDEVRKRPVSHIGNLGLGRWARFPDTWMRAKRRG